MGKVCFVCEVEGTEQEALDTNINSCPCCHMLLENTPKLLAHITAHVLYDSSIEQASEPCGLCLKPSSLCQFVLQRNKGAIGVDFTKSTCVRLTKFSYGPASTPSQTNQCGNVPLKCTHFPKGSSTVWRYNLDAHYCAKHSPALPPAELMITDFELEGIKMLWDNCHTANWGEVRCQKQLRPHFVISEAHST